jgi:tetratricopeptide (TPR) repeat protein
MYSITGQIDLALADLDRLMVVAPNEFETYFNRASIIYMQIKDYTEAIDQYTRSLMYAKNDGDYYLAYLERGIAYLQSDTPQHIDKAKSDLSMAIEKMPTESCTYLNRAIVYGTDMEDEKALEEINNALELDSGQPLFYIHRAWTYRNLRRPEDAIADAEEAIHIYSIGSHPMCAWPAIQSTFYSYHPESYYSTRHNIDILNGLNGAKLVEGWSYFDLKEYEKAFAEFADIAKSDLNGYFWSGYAHHLLQDYPGVIKDIGVVLSAKPNNSRCLFMYAAAEYALGDPTKAKADATKSLVNNSAFWEPYLLLGKIAEEEGDIPVTFPPKTDPARMLVWIGKQEERWQRNGLLLSKL